MHAEDNSSKLGDGGGDANNARKESSSPPLDSLLDEKWTDTRILPSPHEFLHSTLLLQRHQNTHWNTEELSLQEDITTLNSRCPARVRRLIFRANALLAMGDVAVVRIADAFKSITSPQVNAFFADQIARENIHQMSYTGVLDLINEPYHREFLTSLKFENSLNVAFEPFNRLLEYFPQPNLAVSLLTLMCFERLLFATAFTINLYAGNVGYGLKIADLTSLVMRDEYLHYQHARILLAQLSTKLSSRQTCLILAVFELCMGTFIERLFCLDWDERGNTDVYREENMRDDFHDVLNCKNMKKYYQMQHYHFLFENKIVQRLPDPDEELVKLFSHTSTNDNESQTNLMEATSTIYVST